MVQIGLVTPIAAVMTAVLAAVRAGTLQDILFHGSIERARQMPCMARFVAGE
jgi:hypothetical protein